MKTGPCIVGAEKRHEQFGIQGFYVARSWKARIGRSHRSERAEVLDTIIIIGLAAIFRAGGETNFAGRQSEERPVRPQGCRPAFECVDRLVAAPDKVDRRRIVGAAIAKDIERRRRVGVGERYREPRAVDDVSRIRLASLHAEGAADLDAPIADALFETGGRRDGADPALVDLRSDVVDKIIGHLDRLTGAERIDVEGIGHRYARRSQRRDVADPAIFALRGKDRRAEGQTVSEIELERAIKAVDPLAGEDVGLGAIVSAVLNPRQCLCGSKVSAVLAGWDAEDLAVRGPDRTGAGIDRPIVGTAERAKILAREIALACREGSAVRILIGHHETAAAPRLSEELAELDFGHVAVGGACAQHRFGTFEAVAEAEVDHARHRIRSINGRGSVGQHFDPLDRARGYERDIGK